MTDPERFRWILLVASGLSLGGAGYRALRGVVQAWRDRNPWELGKTIVWGGLFALVWLFAVLIYHVRRVAPSTLAWHYLECLVAIFVGLAVVTLGEHFGRIESI